MNKLFLTPFALFISSILYAQIPSIQLPQAHAMPQYGNFSHSNNNAPTSTIYSSSSSSFSKRETNDLSVYDPNEINKRNQANQQLIEEAVAHYREQEDRTFLAQSLIRNGFPSWQGAPGTEYFNASYRELNEMLTGSSPLNLSRAVFLVENAYLDNRLNYSDFSKAIEEKAQLCIWRINDLKLNPRDKLAQNMAIYSLLTDTLSIKQPGTEKTITHYPLKYNLDDYQSKQNYTSHFVATLLAGNTGQCHSMPLLYLLIAEKLGAEAYLSYAPQHSFVKIKDDHGAWYNIELTCRYILSDYHYMNHSYIKSEAIRNKLYLNPLDKKETVVGMMVQLGRYYMVKYGYDPFILQCTKAAKEYMPNSLDALLIEAHYQTRLTLEIARLLNPPSPEAMQESSPEAYAHYLKMLELYKGLDDLGYEETPPEIYQNWLNHVAKEKEKEAKNPHPGLKMIVR